MYSPKIFISKVLLFLLFTSNCQALANPQDLASMENLIAKKQYTQAALKNIELLKQANQKRPSSKEFRKLQDATSRLVTFLSDGGKTQDAIRLAKWHYMTATKLFGEKSAEQIASMQDVQYSIRNTDSSKSNELMKLQHNYTNGLRKAGRFEDSAWLYERNKKRLSGMIDDAYSSVLKQYEALRKTNPDLKKLPTGK